MSQQPKAKMPPAGTSNSEGNIARQQRQKAATVMPAAPYPPMMAHRNPSTPQQQLKSSLSSKPQYSSSSLGSSSPAAIATTTAEASAPGGGGETATANGKKTSLPCAVRFCHPSLVATINPATVDLDKTETRKWGPVLLELQRLVWEPSATSLYRLETVTKSRGNPSLGTSVASTCLDVKRHNEGLSAYPAMVQPCATGLTTGALCIHSFDTWTEGGQVNSSNTSNTEYYHTGRHHRPATAVAWRPGHDQVAIAWAAHQPGSGAASSSSSKRPVSVGSHGRSQPHDRDFACFLWDLHNTKTPLRRLGHMAGATSVDWIMQGQLLVMGSQLRNMLLFDVRAAQPASQPVAALGHHAGVHVRADYHRPHQFATFGTQANEPVKIWDARRLDTSVADVKFTGTVHDVQWSTVSTETAAAYLTVAMGEALYEYEISSSNSRPVQTSMVSTENTVTGFCLYPYPRQSTAENIVPPTPTDRLAELYPHRAVVCYADRTVRDVAKHRLAPVAISKRDGRLVRALGAELWIGNTAHGPAAMESLQIRTTEDVSATMMRRARCLHVAKYSMDTTSNIKLLSEDGLVAANDKEVSPTREALLRLWTWVERMESLRAEDDSGTWAASGLVDAGASYLLRNFPAEEVVDFDTTLACSTYSSPSRTAALTSCGWAGKFDLANVLAECEALGEFERSAALGVWHGNLGAAVQALQRGAVTFRGQSTRKDAYAETLELVALCVAGFRGGSDPSLEIWRQAGANLMERSELSGVNRSVSRVAYMRGLLKFLIALHAEKGHQQVLEDENLSLCDRVGFACRFLPRDQLQAFLETCIEKCKISGNIEGLTVTGIDRTGIQILQAYVDRYADVQTAALVTSRVILPAAWEVEKWTCVEWLDSYRSLLNTWQMWQSRAMFDVDRSELMRSLQTRESSLKGNSRAVAANRRFLMAVPFQMDARCTYCQLSLSLKQNNTNTNQWLREMNKPVLSCCPHCRKPLPRCSVCMLSLGALNPFLDLQARAGRSGRQSPDDLTTASNLPFAEWFSWCMRCKHGGHAHHMVGWFANHEVCPVSGCNCRCQFDGIHKLNRPALSQTNAIVSDNP
jgi:hypothetical protein